MNVLRVGSYARMYVLLVHMKGTLFSTARNFFILTAFRKKKPCHAGRMISVVYSDCEYVTRRRLNYVRAKCIVNRVDFRENESSSQAWKDSQTGDDEPLAQVPNAA
jgi:hypothetical protein